MQEQNMTARPAPSQTAEGARLKDFRCRQASSPAGFAAAE
jgi:hypothetical protein